MRVKQEEVGVALGSIVVPAAGVRGLVVVLVAVVLAAPWLATWSGLLRVDEAAGVVGSPEVVRLRPELVLLPGGRFMMGSPEGEEGREANEVLHEVELSPFFMCRTEVTNDQWKAVMGSSPSDCEYGCGDKQPVQNVTWVQATEYMNALTERENAMFPTEARTRCYEGDGNSTWVEGCTGYRLPSEAEWEYAARAGTRTAYSFGDDPGKLGEHAWFVGNSGENTHPVGEKLANPWGLKDMHGNVWEWVWDRYDDNDNHKVTRDPRGPQNGDLRVLRGDSFRGVPRGLRSAHRFTVRPTDPSGLLGFRCARGSPPAP